MEKFFIVTEQSQLHESYFKYKENRKVINDVVNKFTDKHNIESHEYYVTSDSFYIVPTKSDVEKYEKSLKKEVSNGLRPFKVNSTIGKDWVNTLKENKLFVISKPFVSMYFKEVYGKHKYRIFDIENVLYCSFENQYDELDTPEGFVEIKASEFYKIVEDAESKEK